MADDHDRPDSRTNGDINLEGIARFQNNIDKNLNYCGDLDDDLEFLVKHIDDDTELFHHYIEMKLQNSQENDHGEPDRRTNGDINLEAIARFQNEVDQNPNYCGDLDDDLEFLVRHIDEDPELFHRYVDIVLLCDQEERNNILNPVVRGSLENGSENENNESTMSRLNSAEPGLVAEYHRSREGNPGKRKLLAEMASCFRRREQSSTIPEFVVESSAGVTDVNSLDDGDKIHNAADGVNNGQVWDTGKSLSEKWTILLDECSGDETETEEGLFANRDMTLQKKIKETPDIAGLAENRVIEKQPEHPELIMNMFDQLKRGNEADTWRDSSPLADKYRTARKLVKENPKLAESVVNEMIEEHPEHRDLIMNWFDQLKRGNEADAWRDSSPLADKYRTARTLVKENPKLAESVVNEMIEEHPENRESYMDMLNQLKREDEADAARDSSLYTRDSYRELESHYRTLQQLMKNDPGILDWVVHMLIEENPDKRETCAIVFDHFKRRGNGGKRLGKDSTSMQDTDSEVDSSDDSEVDSSDDTNMSLKWWLGKDSTSMQDTDSEVDSSDDSEVDSSDDTNMSLKTRFKKNPDLMELVFNEFIEEHPEDREICVNLLNQLKCGPEARTGGGSSSLAGRITSLQKKFKKNPELVEPAFVEIIVKHPEKKETYVDLLNQIKCGREANDEKKVLVKYADGIVSFLNELIEEHPEILRDVSDKDIQDLTGKRGGMLSGALRWISEEPTRFDKYTWLKIQNNPEHGREIARMTDYMKLRAKVMTLQEMFEVDPEQFDQLVEEIIQGNQATGDIVVEEAVDPRQKARNLKALDKLMMHLEQNPMYFGEDLIFLLKHSDELPELFDKYVEAIMSYKQEDKNTILHPEQFLKTASWFLEILETHSGNVTSGSVWMTLINDEPALFDEFILSKVEQHPTQCKLIATMAEDLKLLEEESVATGITNSSTVDRNTGHGEGMIPIMRNNGTTDADMKEMTYSGYARSSLEENWSLLLTKYYPSADSTKTRNQPPLEREHPASDVANSVKYLRESLGDFISLIEKSRDSQVEKSEGGGEAMEDKKRNEEVIYYSTETRNQPPLEREHPASDVANSVKYLRESLGDFISLIEKSRDSQVEKSEGGGEAMEDKKRNEEVIYYMNRSIEADETGDERGPLLKELYALSPRSLDGLVATWEEKHQERLKQIKMIWHTERQLQQLQTDSDYSWLQKLLQVDTGKVKETLEHMMRTVLNRNETLVMINELKAPFERKRIIKDYLMTGKKEHFDKILSFVDQYPELLGDVSDDVVKRNSDIEAQVSIRKLRFEKFYQRKKKTTNTTRPIRQSEYVYASTSTGLNGSKSTEVQVATGRGEIIISSLMETDAEVLDNMMKSVRKNRDRQTGDVLRGIRLLKLKMLLDKDSKLLQTMRRIFGFESNDPMPLDAMMKKHLELINDNYPLKTETDTERCTSVAGSANRLGQISDFAENRNEMMKLHNQLQKEGQSKSKHEDISKKIEDINAIISTLKKETRGWLTRYIRKGDVEMVRRFIKAGIDLETKNSAGATMLFSAMKIGREEIAEMLIKAGCDIETGDSMGRGPLTAVVSHGYIGIVKKLIKAGATVEHEEIETAIQAGHVDVLKTLLKHGKHLSRQNGEEWIRIAVLEGHYDMVRLLMKSGIRHTVDEENTWRCTLVETVECGAGNGGAIAVLQTDIMPPSLNMNLDYIRQVAKHGDIDLYRQLVIRCKPRYPDIIDLPYKRDLPYFPVGVCNIHRTVTDRQIDSQCQLNGWFQDMTEITTLPGYGDVNGLFSSEKLGDDPKLHTFHEISEFCDKIVKESINYARIKEHKIRFSYRRCGSSAEGTKVCLPDEFDYFLRCHVDIDDFDIKDEWHGYKMISSIKGDSFLNSMINQGSKVFHDLIITDLTPQMKHEGWIMNKTIFAKGGGNASSEQRLRYKFDDDHSLDISVDIVPVLHVDGWPEDARQNTWLMNKKELQEEGYAFVAKPPSRKSKFGKTFRDEVQQTMWKISFGHLEARHLAELEQRIKDVYITCKAIRNPDISHMMFKDSDGKPLSMSGDLITSYFLKTVFMFNVPEFRLQQRTLVEMVYIVYSQVATCISRWWLPFYWQPHINVLEGLSQNPKQCKQAARLMKRLVTGWYMRDGQSDSVEEEETKEGGIYPYLPRKPNRRRQARGGNGGDDPDDARETRKDHEAIAGGPDNGVGVGGPEVGKGVGDLKNGETDGGPEVGHRIPKNGDTIGGPEVGKVGCPQDGDGGQDPAHARDTKKDDEAIVCGPEGSDKVGNPEIDDGASSPEDGAEDNGAGGCSDDEEDSEDEFEVTTYSRTPNTLRDPGYNLYWL